ncbi:uncharacterized protein LY89DRAFT_706434 [Mollisia scopiformis]|uniref:Cytochrome b5 heme-binding domain-containing protein n=1 Tax=Mollisia scopiformis TaxID=149040 RepID=A0A194XG87_MOLSC|nr:uncharacterized protein LY89DRAFT_706434 [Mollisia scopiformis]KUJ18792.1 hypothetical protein LY89DRAFT_706434 [Mollisia scopiformis]
MLLGISILVASVSYLCYRHPPSSWSILSWLIRPSIQEISTKKEADAPAAPRHNNDDPSTPKMIPLLQEEKIPVLATTMTIDTDKQASDRKAMPPPPLPISNAAPPPPPPTFTLNNNDSSSSSDEEQENTLPPPSFPALNSAQRASAPSSRGPPRLNPLPTTGLMLPPPRPSSSSLPNRNPPSLKTATTTLSPPPTHTQPPLKPRKKVLLTPGHSPLDWARLSSSPTANLRGLPLSTPYLKVPPSLLSLHNGKFVKPPSFSVDGERVRNDAWTVLGGKVYNITPYLPYHPGGEGELLRCAGRDGTRLFGEVHPWVNWEGMLEGCLVGVAVTEEDVVGGGGLEDMD